MNTPEPPSPENPPSPTPSPLPPDELAQEASTEDTPDASSVLIEFHPEKPQKPNALAAPLHSQKNNNPSPTTTPEPASMTSASSILTSWYSLGSNSSYEPLGYDSKVYKTYVANIDKCLKNFEYSIEWPDLIAALTKLNKVISSYNTTLTPQTPQKDPPPQPPPLPRTHLITKRLSQCLHPNLPSGVHLKTLETFDLIFQGFKYHDYTNLEADLFSFISGLLPLWSYAAISVKPKLLSIYETHLVSLQSRITPALGGIMLSLFNGLVDDGVEQDIKIRITSLLSTLQSQNEEAYHKTLNNLVTSHPSIHLPAITHITQISYTPPPETLMTLMSSPNTLVQRNALELLKSYPLTPLSESTLTLVTKTALLSLLKRDMSVTRRVFSFIEPRQPTVISAITSLIHDCIDGLSLTRILSTLLDNPSITILPTILAPVVKYLMKCEYTISVSFLSTISSSFLCSHFTSYLFEYSTLEDLESRVIVFNYVVKLRLFEFDYNTLFTRLIDLDDIHVRVILQMVRLHYTEHQPSFVNFYNAFMSRYYDLRDYTHLQLYPQEENSQTITTTPTKPPNLHTSFTCSSFEFICDLIQKSNPDDTASKYIIISSCINSDYTGSCIRVFIKFQEQLHNLTYNTHAVYLIFKHCYDNNKMLLNSLRYPEKYLLSELHSDEQLRSVIELDLKSSPLVVLKLVDPITMGTPYRRFITETFVRNHGNLVLSSILKYLEFQVDKPVTYSRAKSESNLALEEDEGDNPEFKHATSVVNVMGTSTDVGEQHESKVQTNVCSYDSARVLTLLEKLDFVMSVNENFLDSIDLIVLLSKLTVLSTISNSNEKDPNVTLTIQTRALNCIREISRSHGDSSHAFVYDSLLSHLNNQEGAPSNYSLLWELSAISVIREFLKFDLENYTLALVIQRTLNSNSPTNPMKELHERVQSSWLEAIATNLVHIRKHLNAVVLITYTGVCKNVLDLDPTEPYTLECVKYVNTLLRNVLSVKYTEHSNTTNSGFFGNLFGSASVKHELVDEREALRIALLGKLDLLVKIGCKRNISRLPNLLDLLRYATEVYEQNVLSAIARCFETQNIELVVKELKIPSSKITTVITPEKTIEGINFLCRYLKHDKSIEPASIVLLSKPCVSCKHTLQLVTEYLKHSNAGKVSKEVQDLVVRTIELGVEKREFTVLENYIPGIFDLVWGEIGGAVGENDDRSSVASASSASVRDQKVIVNLVHGVVVAVLVAVKGSSTHQPDNNHTNQASYTSALKVLEQISHHTYLRKAWKKEIFDLITNEQTFFYFTGECLAIWKVIVDNLFTQDRSTFSELITRLTQTTQMSTSALSNIFSSKDSEVYETRASLLKRLAFVLHSSEKDQYAKYITNIQEKIAEALKIGGTSGSIFSDKVSMLVPTVNSSVFLCFRVMVLKFNSNILVSLWPIIVHEVVVVLTNLQTLLDDLLTSITQSTETPLQPPPQPPPQLLALYLQTLKLLNSLFTIPSSDSQIPHFQLYKWAFTDSDHSPEHNNNVNMFVPYVTKLRTTASLLFPNVKFNTPPLKIKHVSTIEELCSGFGCLDTVVPECESEVIDFCDGGGSGEEGGNTDL